MGALTFRDVTLGYDRHPAVHHLSGDVASGALLAVVGPNGAGKSTLFRGIVGMLKPLSGSISLDGARALGLADRIGSIEAGKEADLIVVEPSLTAPIRERDDPDLLADPSALMSRLIFRSHPDMVRGAWVRGRALEGPS